MRSPITTSATTNLGQTGEFSLKLGRVAQCLQLAYIAAQKDSSQQQVYKDRYLKTIKLGAEFAEEIGDYYQAVYYGELLIQQFPQSAEVWYGLGIAKANLSDYPGAKIALNRVLQIAPSHQKARSHLIEIQQLLIS